MSKMSQSDWNLSKYFKETENWGDSSLIEKELVDELNKFREALGTPIVVTCGTQGKHSPNSYHYTGHAVDVMFPEMSLYKIPDIFLIAIKYKFVGIGAYNFWKINGEVRGGLHLDIRPRDIKTTWIGLSSGEYIAMSAFQMYKLFHGLH